ncbi:hypothetical protein [Clostridium phage vB_CpeS-17DYC]|nr:hypothetical protein [Clostridium phage vB_CpeS-17DYC]
MKISVCMKSGTGNHWDYDNYNLPQSKEDKREFITVYVIPC